MPTISMFYGIIIRMYREIKGKHNIPHFHAEYGEYEAVFDLEGNLIEGNLPKKQIKLVDAWASIHEEDLKADWKILCDGEQAIKIEPLR